jgi:hypothetical protein
MSLADDQDPIEESWRTVPTKRSAIAFARGARTGAVMILTSMAVKTASKAAVNLLSAALRFRAATAGTLAKQVWTVHGTANG